MAFEVCLAEIKHKTIFVNEKLSEKEREIEREIFRQRQRVKERERDRQTDKHKCVCVRESVLKKYVLKTEAEFSFLHFLCSMFLAEMKKQRIDVQIICKVIGNKEN